MKKIAVFSVLFIIGLAFLSFTYKGNQEPWVIPGKYKAMKNPHAGDKSLTTVGKTLWAKHCKSCHGSMGLGDGPKAASLKTPCGDFSSAKFQAYKDGELYYMSFVGRDEMPNFEKKIPDDEDRWAIVNYMRTMKK